MEYYEINITILHTTANDSLGTETKKISEKLLKCLLILCVLIRKDSGIKLVGRIFNDMLGLLSGFN